tara:strand:- start:9326 stop:10735 length:1410 start_codon:yes stop_codon:yes gene_type:complete
METYDYYIDKNKNNKYNSELSVIPHHPIINDQDYSILKIKLLDFKFLNSFYNISSTLVNNQFNIRRTTKTYTITGYTGELYLTNEGFFNDQNELIVSEVIDITLHKSTITYDNTSITYYNTATITDDTLSYWQNILNNTQDTSRKMELQGTYVNFFEINCVDEIIYSFEIIFYKDQNVSGSTTDVDIVLQKYNELTTIYDIIETQTITFQNNGSQQISKTFTTSSSSPNEKYRIASNTGSIPFNLYLIKLQANKRIPIFDNGTENTPVENTITLPDGFYKASNFRKKLNELLVSYKINISIDEYTNKIKFTNNNTTFIPTTDDLIDDNFKLDLVIPDNNMKNNLGITLNSYQTYIPIPFNSYYESDMYINLMNFTKIIITTNLSFKNKTHNDILNNVNPYCKSFGNILTWIDTDESPFTCIKYTNYENNEYEIINDHINYISFRFFNENSQELQLDNCLIHFQIKKIIS